MDFLWTPWRYAYIVSAAKATACIFCDALAGKEPQADANGDGYVTGTELGLFLHQKITDLTNNRQFRGMLFKGGHGSELVWAQSNGAGGLQGGGYTDAATW